MSYDIHIGGEDMNCTFNLSRLFYDHIADRGKGGGLKELHGETGRVCSAILAEAFDSMARLQSRLWRNNVTGAPEFCAQYDPPNGWGSTVAGILFLGQLMAACNAHPRHKLTLSM